MRTADFDYALPEELIAQAPADRRDHSRLLAVGRDPEDRRFAELIELLPEGAVVVANDTRVRAARLHLRKRSTGGAVELVLLEPAPENMKLGAEGSPEPLRGSVRASVGPRRFLALARSSKPIRAGAELVAGDGTSIAVAAPRDSRGLIEVELGENVDSLCARLGQLPLPPYIRRSPGAADAERYQTVFARTPGSVAAPTAGLHLTPELIEAIGASGRTWAPITLEVGLGTFAPVRVESIDEHVMHRERYTIGEATAELVSGDRPVVAIGTTAVRALESAADAGGRVRPGPGETDLFIRPGYEFRVVDALVTNFHLPRSTLLMLVSAFAGRERVLAAYRRAVERRYRFFSYGDAMYLERER